MAKKKTKAKKTASGTIDYPFLIITLIILSIGLLMVFSASYASAYYEGLASTYYFRRQALFAVFGLGLAFIVVKIGYRKLLNWSWLAILGSIVLLVLVLAVGVGLYGEKRWIYIGFNFQPSEVAKTSIILFFAFLSTKYADKIKTFKYGVLPFALVLGIICVLMVLEPHYSGAIIIAAIGGVMMLIGGCSLKWVAGAGVLAASAIAVKIAREPYALKRILTAFDPAADAQGAGYQTLQALYAIGAGGLFGLGFGNSRQKYLYLPEPHNDFIFAIVCEELGFIGAMIVIVLFAMLIIRGFQIAMRAPDKAGAMVVVGVTTHLALQIVLNLAVVTGVFPVTGVSLPLFSYGGTALVMQLIEIGLVLSVSKEIKAPKAG